jgi:hypothetical protein
MERPEESDVGYPEEQPAEVAGDAQAPGTDAPQREGGRGGAERPEGPGDDGTATGNPNAAGADEEDPG